MKNSFKYSIYMPEKTADCGLQYSIEQTLSSIFGGCTIAPMLWGYYKNQNNKIFSELTTVIYTITDQDPIAVMEVFKALAKEVKQKLKQESILITKEPIESLFI